jgi:outer membrane protein OmpA-like peptidoglycan-associated protein
LKTSPFLSSAVAFFLLGGTAALAQAPAEPVEGTSVGMKRTVLDLKYQSQDFKYQIQDFKPKTIDFQVRETDLEILIELPADVLFDFDKDTLRPASTQALANAADMIRTKARGPVKISGYTDAKGSAPYNQKLSERRAQAVKNHLVNKGGLQTVAFNVKGFGAENPIAPNTKADGSDNPDGRQKNRRVEIVMRKTQ